jgi:hypothetical protein
LAEAHINFISRNNRKKFLIPLVAATVPLAGLSYAILKDPKEELAEFDKRPVGLTLIFLFLIFSFGFFCFKYFFDTKDKLTISQDGIWTPTLGVLPWPSISYIYLKETKGKVNERKVLIKLNEKDKEISLDITSLDKTEEEIITALKHYSHDYTIQFLDKEVQKVY